MVGLAQLRAAGLTRDQILHAARLGHIHGCHRGVYCLGIAQLSPLGRLWAAHLAVGEDSLIASHTAGQLWGLRPDAGDVHVIAPKQRRAPRGVVVHRGTVPPGQRRQRHGLPVTTPARALLDMSLDLQPDALQIAINQGLATNVVRLGDFDAVLAASTGHRGVRPLGCALAAQRDDPGAGRTRGEMEALFLTLLRALPNLPPYRRNPTLKLAEDFVVSPDVLFVAERVWVELDSRTWHQQRAAMDRDRRKDQRALANGYAPFRFTWRHLTREWAESSADLLATLAARRP